VTWADRHRPDKGFKRVQVAGRSSDGGIDGVGVLQVNDLPFFDPFD